MSGIKAKDDTSTSSGFSFVSGNEVECQSVGGKSGLTAPLSKMDLKRNTAAEEPAGAGAAKKSTTGIDTNSTASSFVLVEHETTKDDSSGSRWSLVDSSRNEESSAKKQKRESSSNSKGTLDCPLCTFRNSINRTICGMCDAALVANPNLSDDEQLAAYLQQQEGGIPPAQENVYPPLHPGQSQVLLQRSRILANDILAVIQLFQELENENENPPNSIHKKGTDTSAPLHRHPVLPLPQDNFTSFLSHFLEYYYEHQSTTGKNYIIKLCYCVTPNEEASTIQQKGFGCNRRFAATPEAAVASYQCHNLQYEHGWNSTHRHNKRQQNRQTGLNGIVQRILEQQLRTEADESAAAIDSNSTSIPANCTAWMVAIPGWQDDANKSTRDFQVAVRSDNKVSAAMIYHRDQSLPLASFPAEMIHQNGAGIGRLYNRLYKILNESFAGCLPITIQGAASPIKTTTPLAAGLPSSGWASIKRSDRALPKWR